MTEERILIPEKLFVGIFAGVSTNMASVTAWGTDSAAQSRMQTVSKHTQNAITINNVPVTGIKLAHGWGEDVKITDPRGFTVSVKLKNVMLTLSESATCNLEIVDPCVWARIKGDNMLLSIHSDLYQRAVVQTEIANSKASWKKAQAGNRVTLVDGTKGIYLGRHHLLMLDSGPRSVGVSAKQQLITGSTPNHVVWADATPSTHSYLKTGANMKLAQIDAVRNLNSVEAEAELNSRLASAPIDHRFSWNTRWVAGSVTPIDVARITLELEQVDVGDDRMFNHMRRRMWLARTPLGQLGVIQSVNRYHTVVLQIIDECALRKHQMLYKLQDLRNHSTIQIETAHRDQIDQVYQLLAVYQTNSGYQIKAAI